MAVAMPLGPMNGPVMNKRVTKANPLRFKPGRDASLVSRSERVVSIAAENIVKYHKQIQTAIGERPFGTEKLPERKQVLRYVAIRDNPQAWTQMIQTFGLKAAIDYALRVEPLLKKYPEEAKFFEAE